MNGEKAENERKQKLERERERGGERKGEEQVSVTRMNGSVCFRTQNSKCLSSISVSFDRPFLTATLHRGWNVSKVYSEEKYERIFVLDLQE